MFHGSANRHAHAWSAFCCGAVKGQFLQQQSSAECSKALLRPFSLSDWQNWVRARADVGVFCFSQILQPCWFRFSLTMIFEWFRNGGSVTWLINSLIRWIKGAVVSKPVTSATNFFIGWDIRPTTSHFDWWFVSKCFYQLNKSGLRRLQASFVNQLLAGLQISDRHALSCFWGGLRTDVGWGLV